MRWMLHQQAFFIKQRLFSLLSALLLDNRTSGRWRAQLLRLCGARIGRGCVVRSHLQVQEGFRLSLKEDVFINAGCCIDGAAWVSLGARVQVAYQVTFVTGGHQLGPRERRAGERQAEPITVGDGAWIGARAVLLPGVTIGEGAVVAAGAVVTHPVPPHTVVAGIPAQIIRHLWE